MNSQQNIFAISPIFAEVPNSFKTKGSDLCYPHNLSQNLNFNLCLIWVWFSKKEISGETSETKFKEQYLSNKMDAIPVYNPTHLAEVEDSNRQPLCCRRNALQNPFIFLTNISRCSTGCGHDITCPLHLRQPKITDHDLWSILGVEIQQILRLRVETHTHSNQSHQNTHD